LRRQKLEIAVTIAGLAGGTLAICVALRAVIGASGDIALIS
jgi:hypothetical protein